MGCVVLTVSWNNNTNIRSPLKYQLDISPIRRSLSYATTCGTNTPSPLPLLIGGDGSGQGGSVMAAVGWYVFTNDFILLLFLPSFLF